MMLLSRLISRKGKDAAKAQVANAQAPAPLFERLEERAFFTVTPAPPTHLTVSMATASTVKLKWSDNSTRESGYSLERSTDGKTFGPLNKVGANVSTYTSGNVTKGKKYYYRVRAFNSGGNSDYTNTASIIIGSTSTTPTTTTSKAAEVPTGAHGHASGGVGSYASGQWYFDGVSIGLDSIQEAYKVIPIMKDLHIGSVRLWWGMDTWNNRAGNWAIKEAAAFKKAGFKVMMNVGVPDVPSYDQAASFFKYVRSRGDALKAVDLWEIGNEPNQKSFWKGSPSQYVNNVLKAAWDVLHPAGAKIVGAGPTWDANFARILVSAGYNKYCDFANFHPYGPSPQEVLNRAKGAQAAYGSKPLIFSEWNVRGSEDNPTQWAKNVDAARKLIAPIAEIAFYFPFKIGSTMAEKGGLVTKTTFAKHQPFYDMFKDWGE